MTASRTDPILVLGGTGKTGRRVVAAPAGARRRRAASARAPASRRSTGTTAPPGRPRCAAPARLHLLLPRPGRAGRGRRRSARFAELAVAGGMRRLVLLSGRGEEEAQRAEPRCRPAGADWTIVRCSWFAQNFSEGFLLEPVLAGELALPVGDVREPFVDADDIADVAVAALTEDGHAGELYELTGPRLLTFAEAVGEIAAPPAARSASCRSPIADYAARAGRRRRARGRRRAAARTCSPRCSTAATRASPTACSGRSAARRATSPTTRGARPRRAPGAWPPRSPSKKSPARPGWSWTEPGRRTDPKGILLGFPKGSGGDPGEASTTASGRGGVL